MYLNCATFCPNLLFNPLKAPFVISKGRLKKNKKIYDKCHIGFDPPPNMTKNTMYFFKKLDQYWGTLAKKNFFAPQKGQNTCKNFLNC